MTLISHDFTRILIGSQQIVCSSHHGRSILRQFSIREQLVYVVEKCLESCVELYLSVSFIQRIFLSSRACTLVFHRNVFDHILQSFRSAALLIYTNANYEPYAIISSVGTNQFDFFHLARDSSTLPDYPSLAITASPSGTGYVDLFLSDRPFTSAGGCSALAKFCMSSSYYWSETLTLLPSATTSTGYFYLAVKGLSAAVYSLALRWRGLSGASIYPGTCLASSLFAHSFPELVMLGDIVAEYRHDDSPGIISHL